MFLRIEIDISAVLALISNHLSKILNVYLLYFAALIRFIFEFLLLDSPVILCTVFSAQHEQKTPLPGAVAYAVREKGAFFRLFTALRSGDWDQQPLCLRQAGKLFLQLVCRKDLRRGYMEPPGHRKHLLPRLRVVDAQGDLGVGVGQRVTKGDTADDRACGHSLRSCPLPGL